MKIVVAGKNNIAIKGVKFLSNQFKHIDCYALPNKESNAKERFPSFRNFCKKNDVKIVDMDWVKKQSDIIFLSLEYDKLIRPADFKTDQLFNIHFSLLPRYKGVYTSAWPIINGDSHSGCTLHRIDYGIDTGPIISQKNFPISNIFSSDRLYETYQREGYELLVESFRSILEESYNELPQDKSPSCYYGKSSINYTAPQINLIQTADSISRWCSAYTFRMYQLPLVAGAKIFGSEILDQKSKKKPGELIKESKYDAIISTIDYDLRLKKDSLHELIDAVKNEDTQLIKLICRIEPQYLKERSLEGWTPLIIAAYNNKPKSLEALIDLGADLNLGNYNETTPLMYAYSAYKNTLDKTCLSMLLSAGANLELEDVNGKNIYQYGFGG